MTQADTTPTRDPADEIAQELAELAEVLERLDDAGWNAPSLCAGWRVREVVAHLTAPVRWSVPGVAAQMLLARFRWDIAADRIARRDAPLPTTALVDAVRSERLRDWRPPGGGAEGALVHAAVHGLDITVPLGIERRLPDARMAFVLDGLARPASLKHFGLDVSDLALRTEDVAWSQGSGREVVADARTMVLFLSGRLPRPGDSAA